MAKKSLAVPPPGGDIEELAGADLEELAAWANKFNAEVETAENAALLAAWKTGHVLLMAKELVAHGEWLPWLADNFRGSRMNAWNYMTLASNVKHAVHLGDFSSIREALRSIGDPGEDEEDGEKPSSSNGSARKSGKKPPTQPCEKFSKRYDPLAEDVLFISQTVTIAISQKP